MKKNIIFFLLIIFIVINSDAQQSGTVTDFDGNIYKTVTIGRQVWMKENLKTTHFSNGFAIYNETGTDNWFNLTTSAYCNYSNNEVNVAVYGRLYNWKAINDTSKICPPGWHVPTDAEWKILEVALGMQQKDAEETSWRGTGEGGKLKEPGTTHWKYPNSGATNSSGFTALPGGFRNKDGAFSNTGFQGYWWTATEIDAANAWYRACHYYDAGIIRGKDLKKNGYSVRCVKDS